MEIEEELGEFRKGVSISVEQFAVLADVRNTLLPDDDETDEPLPWKWLVARFAEHNLDVSVDDLKSLPYEIVLSERLTARLATNAAASGRRLRRLSSEGA